MLIPFIISLIPLGVLSYFLINKKYEIGTTEFYYHIIGTLLLILINLGIVMITISSMSSYKEIWNFKGTKVEYFEEWNETVPCRHPVYRTEFYTVTDSKGRSTVCSREVFDHWMHPFDVDYHPEEWDVKDEYNRSWSISKDTFENWCKVWNQRQFVNLHRNYYTINGNMYEANFPNKFELIYPLSETHTYENKVRVSHSAFKFAKVSDDLKKKYPRPADSSNYNPIIEYGVSISDNDRWKFRLLNASFGVNYKIHNILIVFDAEKYPTSQLEDIRNAWEGPNKNELVTCIGLYKDKKIAWCGVFSWMDDTTIHSLIRQDINEIGIWDSDKILKVYQNLIPKYWKKKSFKDFSYLTIETPNWVYYINFVVAIFVEIGILFTIYKLYNDKYRYELI